MTNNLQAILDEKGISQRGLAKTLGIPSQQVNEWCKNRKLIGIEWAYKIKRALKLGSIEELHSG